MAHISYTMCIRGLPNMYTLSPWACGSRASGVRIRQTTHAHGITITCISYNTGKSALPDIYARCPRASAYISGKARVPVL